VASDSAAAEMKLHRPTLLVSAHAKGQNEFGAVIERQRDASGQSAALENQALAKALQGSKHLCSKFYCHGFAPKFWVKTVSGGLDSSHDPIRLSL
jgi:hypothetical protein